jgi:hypothetical protein
MKNFVDSVAAATERYRTLLDKFIDTNAFVFCRLIFEVATGVSVFYVKSLILEQCLTFHFGAIK